MLDTEEVIDGKTISEWKDSLLKKKYEWEKLYHYGSEDSSFCDGIFLNELRTEILEITEKIKFYSDSSEQTLYRIPEEVSSSYMAREKEIIENAKRLVKKYTQNNEFRYILIKRPQLSLSNRKNLQVDLFIGKVKRLEECIKAGNVLGMRTFGKEKELDDLLKDISKMIDKLPLHMYKSDGILSGKKEKKIEGQMDIYDFIA